MIKFLTKQEQICTICQDNKCYVKTADGCLCANCLTKLMLAAEIQEKDLPTMKTAVIKRYISQRERHYRQAKTYIPTKTIGSYFSCNEEKGLWSVPYLKPIKVYHFDEIKSYELIENGTTLGKGTFNTDLVWENVFGQTDFLYGAKEAVQELKIKVIMKNGKISPVVILLIRENTYPGSYEYNTAYQAANEIFVTYAEMLNQGITAPVEKFETGPTSADKLIQLKELLDEGFLTVEEFMDAKLQVLEGS